MPVKEAVARIEADPISLEIMWSRLVTVVEEMWLTVCRTAFSLVISEAQDFACELLDPSGETWRTRPRDAGVQPDPAAGREGAARRYPAHTLRPGDVLITNDPWLCAGHLFDIAVVTPVFRDGKVVGLMGTVGHVRHRRDEGLAARAGIYEEGSRSAHEALRGGPPQRDAFRLLAENVRNSDQVLGDLHSFVAANAIGAERPCPLMADYGMADLRALASVVRGRSEKAMRDAITALPDGTYMSEIWNNPLGEPMRYPVKLKVEGNRIEIDFEGAPPQLPRAA